MWSSHQVQSPGKAAADKHMGGEKRGSPRWSCYLCQVNQQAVDLYKSVIPCTRTVTDWNGKSTVLSSSHFTDGTVMGNNTIAFIVMSSIAESSTTGLKLPVLRIPQGRAKSPTPSFSMHAYTQHGSAAIHLHLNLSWWSLTPLLAWSFLKSAANFSNLYYSNWKLVRQHGARAPPKNLGFLRIHKKLIRSILVILLRSELFQSLLNSHFFCVYHVNA